MSAHRDEPPAQGGAGQPAFEQSNFPGQYWSGGNRGSSSPGPRGRPSVVMRIVFLAIGLVIVGVIFAILHAHQPGGTGSSGPCHGGRVISGTGVSLGHGDVRYKCADGGSAVVHTGS
jgi:hypothetical protein